MNKDLIEGLVCFILAIIGVIFAFIAGRTGSRTALRIAIACGVGLFTFGLGVLSSH